VLANRFTALIDACALFGALKRNLLLSLAEADLYRVRWTAQILDEVERSIAELLVGKGDQGAAEKARRSRQEMERAFPDASVKGHEALIDCMQGLRDPDDRHILAAALKTRASVIVTDNLRDFPAQVLAPLDLEAKSADEFIADTIDLDVGRAVAAVRQMRERFNRPEIPADRLLLLMEARGLTLTVDMLREHVASL
jgi:hypothetical protein